MIVIEININLNSYLLICFAGYSSYLTPIYKNGAKNLIRNYRPIAKLSVIPKIFEWIINDKLSFFIKEIIPLSQHGFVSGGSTSTNLVCFTNYVVNALESGQDVDVIYTDFSKAFDKISHYLLILKLKAIGIHSSFLNWLSSYLTGRSHFVKIGNVISKNFCATSGVPQGSHLGPSLFLLFIIDINHLFVNIRDLAFADDLKIFSLINSINDDINLQLNLDILCEWCKSNELSLNIKKCKSMRFSRKTISVLPSTYHIDNVALERIYEIVDLGAHYDVCHLVTNKASSLLGFIFRNSNDFSDPYTFQISFLCTCPSST